MVDLVKKEKKQKERASRPNDFYLRLAEKLLQEEEAKMNFERLPEAQKAFLKDIYTYINFMYPQNIFSFPLRFEKFHSYEDVISITSKLKMKLLRYKIIERRKMFKKEKLIVIELEAGD